MFGITLLIFNMILTLRRYAIYIIAQCLISTSVFASIFPENNQKLNHTEMMFEHPPVSGAVLYKVIIVRKKSGQFSRDSIITKQADSTCATFIKNGLHFGNTYTWKYEAIGKNNKLLFTSDTYQFSILSSPLVDSNYARVNIVKPCAEDCEQGVIFIDALGVAVNRQGMPKWFMTGNTGESHFPRHRDIHLSRTGTILFINNDGGYETDLLGNIIWKTPVDINPKSKDEQFHHAFDKDKEFNYMICGKMFITDKDAKINGYTLLKYDPEGKEIWRFDATQAIAEKFGIMPPEDTTKINSLGHLNGFAIDTLRKVIFASFRDFNCVFCIDSESGKIISALGNSHINYEEKNEFDDHLFAAQHAPVLLKNGNLMVFNNNIEGHSSSVVELEVDISNGNCSKGWEYVFGEHTEESAYGGNIYSDRMGIASELPNNNILICMGKVNRILEVNRSKQLVWEVYTETRKDTMTTWGQIPSYRASFASSLYPYYFTIDNVYSGKKIKAGDAINLRINNEGSEDDQYIVELLSDNGSIQYQKNIVDIPKETSKHIDIKTIFVNSFSSQTKVTLKVSALSNPKVAKETNYIIQPN
jgi:hypothetical protein